MRSDEINKARGQTKISNYLKKSLFKSKVIRSFDKHWHFFVKTFISRIHGTYTLEYFVSDTIGFWTRSSQFLLLVRLHDQSSSSDGVGGLLHVLQAPL